MRPSLFSIVSLSGFVLLSGMLIGCDSSKAPRTPAGDPLSSSGYPKVQVIGPQNMWPGERLDSWLFISSPIVTPGTERSMMQVEYPVRSKAVKNIHVQYQFEFFDASGRKLGESGWHFVTLPPRTDTRMNGTALDPAAVDWRLNIKSAE